MDISSSSSKILYGMDNIKNTIYKQTVTYIVQKTEIYKKVYKSRMARVCKPRSLQNSPLRNSIYKLELGLQ